MSDEIKLRKDCVNYGGADFIGLGCEHPKNKKTNFVTGEKTVRMFAQDFRECGECGVEAKFFEPKEAV